MTDNTQIKMIDNEFWDVTLAIVDGQKFKAHKVILSASSIFFKKLLGMNTVIFICRGRHEGIANVETIRDRQGQTGTDRD